MASPDSLMMAIQALHAAIADHPDPQAKATLAQCLQNMLRVQQQDHAQAQQPASPAQAVMAALQGAH